MKLQIGPEKRLWHWTCPEGAEAIGDSGPLATSKLLFLTSVHHTHIGFPDVGHEPECGDLTERYEVQPGLIEVLGWASYRTNVDEELIFKLELVEGAMPLTWWVATGVIPVRYAPD